MVRPLDRTSERQFSRPDDDAFEEALTDPRMPILAPPPEPDEQSVDLPPGFGGCARANGFAPHPATQPSFTTLTFRVAPEPWYRTNAAKLALLALGLGTAVASLVVLLWPTSAPDPRPQDTGLTTPTSSPTASPTQSAPPSASLLPPAPAPPVGLPPGAPPPPAPSADQMSPPAAPPRYYPQYDEPTQKKPQIDVTRAPISVAPTVTQQPPNNSATPGDAPRRRRGFF